MIAILIQKEPYPIHEGHKAVINYARSLGDPIVIMPPHAGMWHKYLKGGIEEVGEENIDVRINSIKELGIPVERMRPVSVHKDIRQKALDFASAFMEPYKDTLILDRYIQVATLLVAGTHLRRKIWKDQMLKSKIPIEAAARGPSVISFFLAQVNPKLGRPPCYVYPKIVKDPRTGIQFQSSINQILGSHRPALERLPMVLGEFKDRLKVGRNLELEKEINGSYYYTPWKIQEIAVFEGGMVPGRLEVVSFRFPCLRGSILIEVTEYYQ